MKKVILAELKELALAAKSNLWKNAKALDRDVKLYLHWSAGHYNQFWDDYHINIDSDGSVYVSTTDLAELKAHTWHRNSGAIGIALLCCAGANTNDLGKESPTGLQIEAMAQVIAVLCKALDLIIDSEWVMTHAEAADQDDYGPKTTCERWDLWFLKTGDKPGTGGNILRGKANFYSERLP
ncbi:peptidoglycan recognition protein family protein [Sporomusa sp.]|uniref:peptidoglycan recognition protein family protein n=1 Tax=Sporomusa sp. TaxID=2078658 RepID=UPI002BCDBE0A|nr:N-acetylmuramoyl-L-alanine amidase [Sporomusa sp.]HWR42783.1 N-acetylmuramoyl-L-alanine amidase [Sporomusa sp.]